MHYDIMQFFNLKLKIYEPVGVSLLNLSDKMETKLKSWNLQNKT